MKYCAAVLSALMIFCFKAAQAKNQEMTKILIGDFPAATCNAIKDSIKNGKTPFAEGHISRTTLYYLPVYSASDAKNITHAEFRRLLNMEGSYAIENTNIHPHPNTGMVLIVAKSVRINLASAARITPWFLAVPSPHQKTTIQAR